jgi:hypothetical protein
MHIRKSRYLVLGQHITLAFVACIADRHPELIDTAPPASPEPPRLSGAERPPRFSERNIRKALGRDPKQSARLLHKVGYEATVRRIERGGV